MEWKQIYWSSVKTDSDAIHIAKSILTGLKKRNLAVQWGSGKITGSFGPAIKGFNSRIFTVYTNGKVQIHFPDIMKNLFIDDNLKCLELLQRINKIPGVQIPKEAIGKYPSFPISTLKTKASLKIFFDAIDLLIN